MADVAVELDVGQGRTEADACVLHEDGGLARVAGAVDEAAGVSVPGVGHGAERKVLARQWEVDDQAAVEVVIAIDVLVGGLAATREAVGGGAADDVVQHIVHAGHEDERGLLVGDEFAEVEA